MVSTNYASEVCSLCQGKGAGPTDPCLVCQGTGTVLVHQPPIRCPRCGGDGRAKAWDGNLQSLPFCIVRGGTGWVMTFSQSISLRKEAGSQH